MVAVLNKLILVVWGIIVDGLVHLQVESPDMFIHKLSFKLESNLRHMTARESRFIMSWV